MILDNFSFMNDTNGKEESFKWVGGPTARQIQHLATGFAMIDEKRRGSLPSSKVRMLLSILPRPLGFRKRDGSLEYGPWEQAAERLIRAELNTIVRHRHDEIRERQDSCLYPLHRSLRAIAGRENDVYRVEFVTFMQTCIFWRKADIVPYLIKASRGQLLDEIVHSAAGIVVMENMSNLVRLRKLAAVIPMMNSMKDHKSFIENDSAAWRRHIAYTHEFAAERDLKKRLRCKALDLYWPAHQKDRLVLEQFDLPARLPAGIELHHGAMKAELQGQVK